MSISDLIDKLKARNAEEGIIIRPMRFYVCKWQNPIKFMAFKTSDNPEEFVASLRELELIEECGNWEAAEEVARNLNLVIEVLEPDD